MIKDSRFTSGKGVISHAGRPLIASEHPLILYPRARSYIDPEVMSGVCRACVTFMLNEPAFAVTRTLRYIFCLGLLAAVVEAMLRARPRAHTRVLILRMLVKAAVVLGRLVAARERLEHVAEQDAVHGVQHKVVVGPCEKRRCSASGVRERQHSRSADI